MGTSAPPRSSLRVAAFLGGAGGMATVLVLPYAFAALGSKAPAKVPFAVLAPLQGLQGGVVLFALAYAGLAMGRSVGLGAPLLSGNACPSARRTLGVATALGLAFGAIIATATSAMPILRGANVAWWKGLLASFYGGIAEEIELRLFLLTLFVWLGAKLSRRTSSEPLPTWLLPSAIVLTALIFGAGHLPLAAALTPLTTTVVVRVIGYNAVLGVVFGFLYKWWGIEHAMVAHFTADLILHVATALVSLR